MTVAAMAIEDFYNKTANVFRITQDTSGWETVETETLIHSSVPCGLQRLRESREFKRGNDTFTADFRIYVAAIGIKDRDIFVIDGDKYRAFQPENIMQLDHHLEVICELVTLK